MYRAILEGIAYGFYHHLEVLAERGLAVGRARVTNGGAHSHLWRQVTADVLGIPLEQLAHHPGSSLGAAFVAGKGEVVPRVVEFEAGGSRRSVFPNEGSFVKANAG